MSSHNNAELINHTSLLNKLYHYYIGKPLPPDIEKIIYYFLYRICANNAALHVQNNRPKRILYGFFSPTTYQRCGGCIYKSFIGKKEVLVTDVVTEKFIGNKFGVGNDIKYVGEIKNYVKSVSVPHRTFLLHDDSNKKFSNTWGVPSKAEWLAAAEPYIRAKRELLHLIHLEVMAQREQMTVQRMQERQHMKKIKSQIKSSHMSYLRRR